MAEATIKDVARLSGYSIKTVSRVINKQPTVTEAIREKVEAAISRLDYQPNLWARALRSSRSHLLALFANEPIVGWMAQIQLATTLACREAGYHLASEIFPEHRPYSSKAIQDIVDSVQMDGAILAAVEADNLPLMKALLAAKVRFVRISPYKHLELSSCVGIDDQMVAREMTEYLIELGHRDIAFIMGPAAHTAAAMRLQGFTAAMKDHGISIREEWVVPGEFNVKSGMEAGLALLSTRKRPTAIFASNDDSAIGVIAASFSKGVSVPRDLSIVGIDDAPIASSFWPKLTTMRQPVSDLGRIAAKMLIEEIETSCERRVEKLDCQLMVRESAGPPPRKRK